MIPNSIEKRRALNKLIERGVQLHREMDQCKDDLKQLKMEVEEEIGKESAKEFTKKVSSAYKAEKIKEDVKKKLEILEELEILKNSHNVKVESPNL